MSWMYRPKLAITGESCSKAYGMRAVFLDRRRRPFGETPHLPDLVVEDVTALAAALA